MLCSIEKIAFSTKLLKEFECVCVKITSFVRNSKTVCLSWFSHSFRSISTFFCFIFHIMKMKSNSFLLHIYLFCFFFCCSFRSLWKQSYNLSICTDVFPYRLDRNGMTQYLFRQKIDAYIKKVSIFSNANISILRRTHHLHESWEWHERLFFLGSFMASVAVNFRHIQMLTKSSRERERKSEKRWIPNSCQNKINKTLKTI